MTYRWTLCILAALLSLMGWMMPAGGLGVALLLAAQFAVMASCVAERQVSAVGSFVFMYLLFFALRPLYFFIEQDWELMSRLFRLPRDLDLPYNALLWAALCVICFRVGSLLPGAERPPAILRRQLLRDQQSRYLLDPRDALPLIALQAVSLMALQWVIARSGGLYGFGTGYIYDLPVPIQALHAFSVMFILQMLRMAPRNRLLLAALVISVSLFVAYTITMRSVSIFRLFYLTGFLVVCFAYLASRQKKVGYAWLILPIIIALPVFDVLGRSRFQSSEMLGAHLRENADSLLVPRNYWDFFEGRRDMNIFDSYTAALQWTPEKQPYFLQWLYPAVHWVPRKIWKDKPPGGMQIDLAGPMRGAPYSPGINGIFYLGGGRLYMLFSMGLLGYCIGRANASILAMREGVLKWTFYGTFIVNSMLLTRFFLFQFVWQILYIVLPCLALNFMLIRKIHLRRSRRPLAQPPRPNAAR